MRLRSSAALVGYIATIPCSNWLVARYGAVPVGLGLSASAGVFTAGAALVLRDLVDDWLGSRAVLAAIVAGAALSYLLSSPKLACASAVAFGLAELADMAVYTPLRRRGLIWAMLASNAVGLLADSGLFLWMAFGSLGYLPGQVLAKTEVTVVAVLLLWGAKHRRPAAA